MTTPTNPPLQEVYTQIRVAREMAQTLHLANLPSEVYSYDDVEDAYREFLAAAKKLNRIIALRDTEVS